MKAREVVRVRMGQFGFCSCLTSTGLCSGCWRIKAACSCAVLKVNPQEEITRKLAEYEHRLKMFRERRKKGKLGFDEEQDER